MYDRELCIIVHVGDSLLLPVVYRYYMYGMIVIHNMLGPLCDKRFDSIQGERHNNNSSSSSSSRRRQAGDHRRLRTQKTTASSNLG